MRPIFRSAAGDLLFCRTLVIVVVVFIAFVASSCTIQVHAFALPAHATPKARRPPSQPSCGRRCSLQFNPLRQRPAISTTAARTRTTTTNGVFLAATNNNNNNNNAVVTEQQAQKGINKVVQALRNDRAARTELGRLEQVTIVLGYGFPRPGTLAVRFNARFKKEGMGRSSVPLPFGLGQSNVSEGRGTMVGQVKASLDVSTGKLTSCSVFRDLGYGRSFELKI